MYKTIKKIIYNQFEVNFDHSFKNISFLYCIFITLFCAKNHYAVDESILLNSLFNQSTVFFVDVATGKSIIHYLGLIFLKLGVSHYFLSISLFFFTNIIFWFSCANIIKKYVTDNAFLILIFVWFITQINLFTFINPSYEYPITYNPHLSTFSSAIFIGSISIFLNQKYTKSIFISLLNIIVHPILGIFNLLILGFFLLLKKIDIFKIEKKNIIYLIIILFLFTFFIVSFSYTQNVIKTSTLISYDDSIQNVDLSITLHKIWELSHRNQSFDLSFYIPSILFAIYLIFLLKYQHYNYFNDNYSLLFVTFMLPFLIAIISQILLFFNFLFIDQYIPGRFLIFSNFVVKLFFFKFIVVLFFHKKFLPLFVFSSFFFLWPFFYSFMINNISLNQLLIFTKLNLYNLSFLVVLLILFSFKAIVNIKGKDKKIIFLSSVLALLVFFYEKKFSSISYFSNSKFKANALLIKENNCPKILPGRGVLVSNFIQYNYLLRSCEIVPFMMPSIQDGIFYNQNKMVEFIDLFKITYGINLLNPKLSKKNDTLIQFNSDLFKKYWEYSVSEELINKLRKLKIKYIVTPQDWNIKLNKVYTFYDNDVYQLF